MVIRENKNSEKKRNRAVGIRRNGSSKKWKFSKEGGWASGNSGKCVRKNYFRETGGNRIL